MPIVYRPSETWPADAGQDEATVLGDENTVIGDESESAAKLIELLSGRPPVDRIFGIVEIECTLERSVEIKVVVNRV